MQTLSKEFKEQANFRMEESITRIKKCFSEINEKEVWQKPNEASNSMGNLILHLCGNITQYIISSLGEKRDNRDRDLEFSSKGGFSKQQLIDKLSIVVIQSINIINGTSDSEMLRTRQVQAYQLSGMGIIIHVVEHFSYHTGQIAFWTKQLRNKDLGFYSGIDLNTTN